MTCGDPVILECRVAGTPHISVKWIKDGKELQSSPKQHLYFENNLSRLVVTASRLDDSGEYVFEAQNTVGTCRCKVQLIVLGV